MDRCDSETVRRKKMVYGISLLYVTDIGFENISLPIFSITYFQSVYFILAVFFPLG